MGVTAAIAGVAAAGGNILGGVLGSNAQQKASQQAIAFMRQNFDLTQGNLAPFISAGQGAVNQLTDLTGTGPNGNPMTAPLTAPFQPTQAQLAQTPGYQFTLNQGLKAVQNSNAAKGLGGSGEALAGAANYAEGLAGTTYQNQFQNYLSQNQQIFNMLNSLSGAGQSAATNLGSIGAGAAANEGQSAIGAGNAKAAMFNTIGQGIGQLGQIPLSYSAYNAFSNNFSGLGGGGNAVNNAFGNVLTNNAFNNAYAPIAGTAAGSLFGIPTNANY